MIYLDVKKTRNNFNLSQRQLSDLTGLSQSYLSELESYPGKKVPSLKTINKIAESLNVCPYEILSCSCSKCLGKK